MRRAARGARRDETAARRRPAASRTPHARARTPRRLPRRPPARGRRPRARRLPAAIGRSLIGCLPRPAREPSSGAPIASRSGAALTSDSATSSDGSESQTTPPPTQRWMRPSAIANVRIVSASSRSPLPWTRPSAPIDAPRPTGSSAAMRSTAAIFGAPVTDPPGKSAWRISASPAPGRTSLSTVETRCSTPASDSATISSGQRTLPGTLTRERSLRSRSTIITCSAASFAEARSPARSPTARVPLIGRVRRRPPPTEEEQLGRGGDDRPAVPSKEAPATVAERRVVRLCQGGQPGGERAHAARERGGEVLDEVDLVDVAAGDRGPDSLDRRGVVPLRPRPAPPSDLQVVMLVVMFDIMPEASDGACGERERARLGWDAASASCGSSPRARSRGRGRPEVPRLPARRTLARGATPRSARRLHRPRAPRAGLGRRAVRRRRCRQRARTCQVSACESSRP